MALKDTVKQWFETGDYPTQSQFYALFDAIRWTDELITINQVIGLAQILNSIASQTVTYDTNGGDYVVSVPMRTLIEKVVIVSPADCAVTITENGAAEPIVDAEVLAAAPLVIALNYMQLANKALVFAGLPFSTRIYCIQRILN